MSGPLTTKRQCDRCRGAVPDRMSRVRDGDDLICNECSTRKRGSGPEPTWSERSSSDYSQGDRILTEYGEGTVEESTGRSLLIALDEGGLIRVQRGTPGFGRLTRISSMRHHAHDSGDNATINHCPFCGSGAVTGGSDGTVDCGYCHTFFTVQVQPSHPNMPQTINGSPQPPPGMPAGNPMEMSTPVDPAVDEDGSGNPTDGFGNAESDMDEQMGTEDPLEDQQPEKPKGPVPPQFKKGSKFFTEDGEVLSFDKYAARLALDYADDRMRVLAEIRETNERARA